MPAARRVAAACGGGAPDTGIGGVDLPQTCPGRRSSLPSACCDRCGGCIWQSCVLMEAQEVTPGRARPPPLGAAGGTATRRRPALGWQRGRGSCGPCDTRGRMQAALMSPGGPRAAAGPRWQGSTRQLALRGVEPAGRALALRASAAAPCTRLCSHQHPQLRAARPQAHFEATAPASTCTPFSPLLSPQQTVPGRVWPLRHPPAAAPLLAQPPLPPPPPTPPEPWRAVAWPPSGLPAVPLSTPASSRGT